MAGSLLTFILSASATSDHAVALDRWPGRPTDQQLHFQLHQCRIGSWQDGGAHWSLISALHFQCFHLLLRPACWLRLAGTAASSLKLLLLTSANHAPVLLLATVADRAPACSCCSPWCSLVLAFQCCSIFVPAKRFVGEFRGVFHLPPLRFSWRAGHQQVFGDEECARGDRTQCHQVAVGVTALATTLGTLASGRLVEPC